MNYSDDKIKSVATESLYRIPMEVCMGPEGLAPGTTLERLRNNCLSDTFRYQIGILNSSCGTNRRKTVWTIAEELDAREIKWTDIFGDMSEIKFTVEGSTFTIRSNKGIDIQYLYCTSHCTAGAEDIVDFLGFFAKAVIKFDTLLGEKCLRAKRSKMVSDISLPLIQVKAKEFFEPKGINYNIFQKGDKITLEVQIINKLWMSNYVTGTNIDSLLGIVPYLIKRTDCISKDGRGFKIIYK